MRVLGVCFLFFYFSFLFGQQPMQNVAVVSGVIDSCGIDGFGFGCSFADFDNDGFDDLSFSTQSGRKIHFYKNNGNGTFTKLPPFVQDTSLQRQVLWVDYDNDNDLDLFFTTATGQCFLYEKNNTSFINVTSAAGITVSGGEGFGATFGDIDKDGDLDLYVSNRALSNTLYRNNVNSGSKTFTNITASSGTSSSSDPDFCSAMFDFDNDNDLDIYTIVDKFGFTNKLYKNNGNNVFAESGNSTGSNLSIDAMNAGIGDYNNDGWFDIYVTNSLLGNVLLYNNFGYFYNLASTAGVEMLNQICWGASFVDINNDKFQDLYVCSENHAPNQRNKLFKNNKDETFTEFTSSGLPGDTLTSFSNVVGDFNNDGRPDIAVSNAGNEKIILWKNNTLGNNYIKIDLEGVQSNKKAVGSKIVVFDNDSTQYRFTHCGINYLGQNSYVEHFGMGNNTKIDSLIVTWPFANNTSKFYNLGVNQQFKIKEGTCLNHSYNGINTAAKKYIGPNNGDVALDANWSSNKAPTFLDDVEISGPISLTIANGKTLKCRSLKSSNGAVITNTGTLQIKESYGDALVIGAGTIFNNNAFITVNKACGRSTVIEGSFIDKGSLTVSKN